MGLAISYTYSYPTESAMFSAIAGACSLTGFQRVMLEAVHNMTVHGAWHKLMMTRAELMARVGCRSMKTVETGLRRLEELGLIVRESKVGRHGILIARALFRNEPNASGNNGKNDRTELEELDKNNMTESVMAMANSLTRQCGYNVPSSQRDEVERLWNEARAAKWHDSQIKAQWSALVERRKASSKNGSIPWQRAVGKLSTFLKRLVEGKEFDGYRWVESKKRSKACASAHNPVTYDGSVWRYSCGWYTTSGRADFYSPAQMSELICR